MIRVALLCGALVYAPVAQAQDAVGEIPLPRSVAFFQGVEGYGDLAPDRFGTPARPAQDDFGVVMLVRMLHNVCGGLERGAAFEDVIPDGFATYPSFEYSLGETPAPLAEPSDYVALSVTGSIDTDEQEGHPYMFLGPRNGMMDCTLRWHFDGVASAERHLQMAIRLHTNPPGVLGLVPYSDTNVNVLPTGIFVNFLQFDRFCGGQWCALNMTYNLQDGEVSFSTALNIPTIQGTGR